MSIHRRVSMGFAASAIALALAGCQRVTELYVSEAAATREAASAEQIRGGAALPPINLDEYVFPEDRSGNKKLAYVQAIEAEKISGQAETAKYYRNRLQFLIMERSDEICKVTQGAILANAASIGFGTGLVAAALSSVSAAVTGEVAKTALATGAAITGSAGALARAEFYQNLFAGAIVKEIDRLRIKEREAIGKKTPLPIGTYSVDHAIGDAVRYNAMCSFYVGVVSLTDDKTPRQMTRSQIDKEIAVLTAENKKLLGEFQGKNRAALNALEQSAFDASKRQYEQNTIRIEALMHMRATMPLSVDHTPSAPQESAPSSAAGSGGR